MWSYYSVNAGNGSEVLHVPNNFIAECWKDSEGKERFRIYFKKPSHLSDAVLALKRNRELMARRLEEGFIEPVEIEDKDIGLFRQNCSKRDNQAARDIAKNIFYYAREKLFGDCEELRENGRAREEQEGIEAYFSVNPFDGDSTLHIPGVMAARYDQAGNQLKLLYDPRGLEELAVRLNRNKEALELGIERGFIIPVCVEKEHIDEMEELKKMNARDLIAEKAEEIYDIATQKVDDEMQYRFGYTPEEEDGEEEDGEEEE